MSQPERTADRTVALIVGVVILALLIWKEYL